MSALDKWNLERLYGEVWHTDEDTLRVPAKLVLDLTEGNVLQRLRCVRSAETNASLAALIHSFDDLRAQAHHSRDAMLHAQKKYRRDRSETGLLRIDRRQLLHLLVAARHFLAIEDPQALQAVPPLDMTPVSVEKIRRKLRGEPEPRAAVQEVATYGKPLWWQAACAKLFAADPVAQTLYREMGGCLPGFGKTQLQEVMDAAMECSPELRSRIDKSFALVPELLKKDITSFESMEDWNTGKVLDCFAPRLAELAERIGAGADLTYDAAFCDSRNGPLPNAAEIKERVGAWDADEEPGSFRDGYFMAVQDTGTMCCGDIVRGALWEDDRVHGYRALWATCSAAVCGADLVQGWWCPESRVAFLGKTWDPRWLVLSEELRGDACPGFNFFPETLEALQE